ncbi:hypothetical protein E1176_09595 [Fulvivirga sp. RKSG066]|uniref:hypothetical protein n=1 Tax=Fulvivirga aurantia TaxID=2529383 RepID=UPI0012BB4A35|nr:hypothetical protein [Fulvivirga aurantia]MTI21273.1 hypothetical protein [Fulvivirga aurantia]
MGRHEIRLRRKRMTSRRIEGHKNYYDVLRKHQRSSRLKKLFKLIVLLLFFLALVFFSYSLLTKVNEAEKSEPTSTMTIKTSRPGDLNHILT